MGERGIGNALAGLTEQVNSLSKSTPGFGLSMAFKAGALMPVNDYMGKKSRIVLVKGEKAREASRGGSD